MTGTWGDKEGRVGGGGGVMHGPEREVRAGGCDGGAGGGCDSGGDRAGGDWGDCVQQERTRIKFELSFRFFSKIASWQSSSPFEMAAGTHFFFS